MKNIFNNQVVRKVRDEVNDLRKKNKDTTPDQETSSAFPPTYYHHPPSTSSTTDSYSHTANSTAGYSQKSTYPTLTTYNQEREKQTLLGKIESTTTNLLGNIVGQDTIVSATNRLNSAVTSGRNARELLQSGATVQLVSKNSGHLLQVVMSTTGTLVFDGNGAANSFNTYFTVEEGEKGRLRFHNNYNYLAFEGKQACLMSLPPGAKNNSNIDFRVHDILGSHELVAFESCACKNCFISISTDGHLKTMNIKDKNVDAQFSIVPVTNNQQPMSPYQTQPYQQFNMNPYGGFPPNSASGYMPPQPTMYHQQPPMPPQPPMYHQQPPVPPQPTMYHQQPPMPPQPPMYHQQPPVPPQPTMYHQQPPMPPQPPMYHQQPPVPPQPSMYHQQTPVPAQPPSAPPQPPPYSTQSSFNQPSTSSGLYPQFN